MRLSSVFMFLPLCCLGQPSEPKRCADQWAALFAIDRQLVYAISPRNLNPLGIPTLFRWLAPQDSCS